MKLTYWCYDYFADIIFKEWFLQNEIMIKMLARPFDKKDFWWLKLSCLKEHQFHKEKLNYLISLDQWTTPSQSFQSLKGSGDKNWVENLTMEI